MDIAETVLTIAVPVFNEIDCVDELYCRLSLVGQSMGLKDYVLLFVDDGSVDGTLEYLRAKACVDNHLSVVALSRNFGLQGALSACLCHAGGDVVVIIDGDLQDPPELIPDLLQLWQQGAEVVYTVKRSRKDPFLKKRLFSAFYWIQKRLVSSASPSQSGNFSLLDKKVIQVYRSLSEANRFFPGLRKWCGFQQVAYYYDRDFRMAGKPKMSFPKLMKLGLDGIFSNTRVPLQLSFFLGMFMIVVSLLLVVYVIYSRFISNMAIPGWASIIVTVAMIGGVQLVALSILGEYVFRTFTNTQRRPDYIIRDIYSSRES